MECIMLLVLSQLKWNLQQTGQMNQPATPTAIYCPDQSTSCVNNTRCNVQFINDW